VLQYQVLNKLINFKHLQTISLFVFYTKDTPQSHEKGQLANRLFHYLYKRQFFLHELHDWLYERQKKVMKKPGLSPVKEGTSYGLHKNELVGCPVTSVEQFSFFVCLVAWKVNTLLLFSDTFFMI